MNILLVTMGGAMDLPLNGETETTPPARSHAFLELTRLCKVRSRKVEPTVADHLPLGARGAKITSSESCKMLYTALYQQQKNYDRIVVTLPAREAFWASRRIATDLLLPQTVITFTGAEAPDPTNFAVNRTNNLIQAAFVHPYIGAGVYLAEGEVFNSALSHQAEYRPIHAPRPRPFSRRSFPPLGPAQPQP